MAEFLLDANLSPETAVYLRELGFEVKSVQEEGWGRFSDEEITELAVRNGWILVWV